MICPLLAARGFLLMRVLAVAVFFCCFLSGCATEIMSEEECLAADWYAAGLEDGAQGRLDAAFDERIAQCREFAAPPADGNAYAEGREAGLARLCTEPGGYQYGRAGAAYLGVCRPEREALFLEGYLSGRRIYQAERARDAAQSAYDSAAYSIDFHRDQIRRARRRLNDPDATEKQIRKARKNLDYHRGQIPYAELDADQKLYELGRADEALDAAVATAGDWRRSEGFLASRDALLEAHDFARNERAIDYCTDELPAYAPLCEVRPGATLTDVRSGAVCAAGPGEARFMRRQPRYADGQTVGALQVFSFFPRDARGRPAGVFEVHFDGEGAYAGIACRARPETPDP